MNMNQLSVALYTIIYKEVRRFMRIWPQTLLPPAITMSLYFVIFGNLSAHALEKWAAIVIWSSLCPV